MSLPAEIRRRIYGQLLSQQDTDPHGTEWAHWNRYPLPDVLLCLTRGVYDEVLDLLYTRNCATVQVIPSGCHLPEDSFIFYGVAREFSLTDISPLVKNWQISVDGFLFGGCCPGEGLHLSNTDTERRDGWWLNNMRRQVDGCIQVLSQNNGIHTLKVKTPCLCYLGCHKSCVKTSGGYRFLSSHLQPLKQIRVTIRCTFLASDLLMNTQCTQPGCVDLANSFTGFKHIIEGKATTLETMEEKWLAMEQRAMEMPLEELAQISEGDPCSEDLQSECPTNLDRVKTKMDDWVKDYQQLVREEGEPPSWLDLAKIHGRKPIVRRKPVVGHKPKEHSTLGEHFSCDLILSYV